jgi:hypothetical protein
VPTDFAVWLSVLMTRQTASLEATGVGR